MSSRRGRIEVIKDILTEASSGASKTRIIYRANLNFSQFNRYFSEMVKKGLIVWVNNPGGGVAYQTTEKGRALLEVLRKVEQFILL